MRGGRTPPPAYEGVADEVLRSPSPSPEREILIFEPISVPQPTQPSAPARGRKKMDQPRNDTPAPLPSQTTFELLAEVTMPDKQTRQRSGKTKNEKRVPIKKGPIDVDVDVGWDTLLVLLAELLQTSPDNLVHNSFEWHWLKPASGAWLPLTDEHGLSSMLKQILTQAGPYVIVRMQPPKVDSAPASVSACISTVNWKLIHFYFSPGRINLTLPLLKTSLRRIQDL